MEIYEEDGRKDDEPGRYGEPPQNWLTGWVINFYPVDGGFGGFSRKDFTDEEMAELRDACESVGGKLTWFQGGGPGAHASCGLRGVTLDTRDAARSVAEELDAILSRTICTNLSVSHRQGSQARLGKTPQHKAHSTEFKKKYGKIG
mgnify:CR=1 FL=1